MIGFFHSLTPTKRFEASFDTALYTRAPDDWSVAVFDIIGSTKAIENNRYKDVNAVGVCCITAAINALRTKDVPYVFGGDGATILFPNAERRELSNAMLGLQAMTEQEFGLRLRTGIVPISDIRARGLDVLVSRFELSDAKSVALLAGGGAQLADQLVKDKEQGQTYRIDKKASGSAEPTADTEGFSCRWQPIRTQRGQIITGLVQSQRSNDMRAYERAIACLCDVIGDPRLRNPARSPQSALSGRWSDYEKEANLAVSQGRRPSRFWAQFKAFRDTQLGRLFAWLNLKLGSYDGKRYKAILTQQTDHLRFDDMLRFVLDVSHDEAKAILKGFEELREANHIFYGNQSSATALMTCIVNDYDSDHVHFLDGGDGGFAMAAKQLKAQISTTANES